MSMETQNIIKRSATNSTIPPPQVRNYKAKVAELIDVSTCIGYKAYQVTYSGWNDIRDEVDHYVGAYGNPANLSAKLRTVVRFTETEQDGKLGWLVRKNDCTHCEGPDCPKMCSPAGVITQYVNGIVNFQSGHCVGYGYCVAGCPFSIPRPNKEDNRVYKYMLRVDRISVGQKSVCVKTCPAGTVRFSIKQEILEMGE